MPKQTFNPLGDFGAGSFDLIETDHGAQDGLGDDDHTQYLLIDGMRAMTGNLVVDGGLIGLTTDPDLISMAGGLLTVNGNLLVNSALIGFSGDTDLIQMALNVLTVNGDLIVTSGKIGILTDLDLIQMADNFLTVTGKIVVEVDPSGTYDSTTVAAIFGDSDSADNLYIIGESLNAAYGLDVDGLAVRLNYRGYQGGLTRYRDTIIYDGKGNQLAVFTGNPSAVIQLNGIVFTTGAIVADIDTGGIYSGATISALLGDQDAGAADNVYFIGETINSGWGYDADGASLYVNYRGYSGGTTRFRDFRVSDGKGTDVAVFSGSSKLVTLSGDLIVGGGDVKFSTAAATGSIRQSGDNIVIDSSIHGASVLIQSEDVAGVLRSLALFSPDTGTSIYHLGGAALATTSNGITVVSDIGTPSDTDLLALSNDLLTINGNLLVDGGNIGIAADTDLIQMASAALTVNGEITSLPDTDSTYIFGRAVVGHLTGVNDYAAFTHYDRQTAGTYAILAYSVGDTFVNCSTGRTLYLRSNNTSIMELTTGQTTITGNLTTNGKTICEKDTGGTYDSTTVALIAGDSDSVDNIFVIGNTIQSGYGHNANTGLWVNYRGYNAGTTQFRDLHVADGKGTQIAMFDGSTGRLSLGPSIAPTQQLHLNDAIAGGVETYIENTSTDNAAYSALRLKTADSAIGYVVIGDPGATNADIANRLDIYAGASCLGVSITADDASGNIRMFAGGRTNERLRIDSSGAVMVYQTSGYLNFSTTAGTSGYGFRDNSGVMEAKDSGGSWAPVRPEYGEIYCHDSAATTSVSSAGWTQVTNFDTNGESHTTTPDHTNDHITITNAGKYLVTVSAAVENSAGVGHVVEFSVFKNNGATEFLNIHAHRTLGAGSDIGSISLSGTADLAANDTVELWASSDSGVARNITVSDCTLTVVRVG